MQSQVLAAGDPGPHLDIGAPAPADDPDVDRGHALPVYAGDDRTDEPAFAALSHGVTIRVGRRILTRAHFQLRDPGEVRSFLEKLSIEMA